MTISIELLNEPKLIFGGNRLCADPKIGLTSFGPTGVDVEHGRGELINVGAIGTYQSLASLRSFLNRLSFAISYERKSSLQPWKADFPGLSLDGPLGFDIRLDESNIQGITEAEEHAALRDDNRKLRIERAVDLYDLKIRDLVNASASLPRVILLPLSKRLIERCKDPNSDTDRIVYQKRTMERKFRGDFPIFDFHHVMKVLSFQRLLTCQILRPHTLSFAHGTQDAATIAWNFSTAIYYKGTGNPWKLANLEDSTCLVGISFYQQMSEQGSSMRASMAHVYVKSSESQVILGKPFPWKTEDPRREPSLDENHAKDLIERVIQYFERQASKKPTRLVVHKSTPFTREECSGFDSAASGIELVDYVHIQSREGVRFFHEGSDYPPVRGTMIWSPGQSPIVLYSVGYVPSLGTYQGSTTPYPLILDIPRNDTNPRQIGEDILSLTKLDWNSTEFCAREPVTISVSRKVGHILTEMKARQIKDPPEPYRYYM